MDDALHWMFHSMENGIGRVSTNGVHSVGYDVVGQVMVVLLPDGVIIKTLDAHTASVSVTDEARGGFAKKLLASAPFSAPITTFIRSKTDSAVEKKK